MLFLTSVHDLSVLPKLFKMAMHEYAVRPRKDKRGADLISDACHSVGCGTRQIKCG
jgi:hypothetical protein